MSNLMNQARLKVLKARDDMITVSKQFFSFLQVVPTSAALIVTVMEFILAMNYDFEFLFQTMHFLWLIATVVQVPASCQ